MDTIIKEAPEAGPPSKPKTAKEPIVASVPGRNAPHNSVQLLEKSRADTVTVLKELGSQLVGLSSAEADSRLKQVGTNEIAREKRQSAMMRLLSNIKNPLVLLLTALGVLSFLTGDLRATVVIFVMVVLGVVLRFFQEMRADNAAARLQAMVSNTATLVRDGKDAEVSLKMLVPGDIIRLAAGDMVPADARVLSAKDLFLNQAALTGEALPVEKKADPAPTAVQNPLELPNICFLGSNVESGCATAVVIHTGDRTYFGSLAASIVGQRQLTSFDLGINKFTWLMIRFIAVMVPAVFLINGLSKHNWLEAFLFAMAVAVGLTPEMLPMIVTVNLSKGALAMSRKKVIVKRLNAIQNFGAMDVLCTDKTGTLTQGKIVLEKHLDVHGEIVSAIERMQEVLRENPGYSAGWQNLAEWLWQRKQREEAVAAVTNVRRLDPFNPVPLGYRASMKVQKEDRAGAKADLERALKYDPAYTFASLNLFDLQLADEEVDAAKRTLELIDRYVGGEKAKSCEVRLRGKLLETSAAQKNRTQAPEIRRQELEQAFGHFKDLCASDKSSREDFNAAVTALLDAGQSKRVEQVLQETILLPGCNLAVGDWWMRRRIERGRWSSSGKINRLCPTSAAARQAVLTLIESLAEKRQPIGRNMLVVYLVLVIQRFLARQGRTGALLWLAWRHRRWLRADNNGWASMGYALVRMGRFTTAIYWMRDWRDRQDVKMWMLLNLVLALRERWRWKRTRDVLGFAVRLPARDHSFQKLRLLFTMELALAGDTQQAAQHFRELDATGWSTYMLLQRRFARGLLSVQQAAVADKVKVFRSERRGIRKLLTEHSLSRFRFDYSRSMLRMAKDTGRWWVSLLTWLWL